MSDVVRRCAVGVCAALVLVAGQAAASADPAVDTNCSYDQVVAAMRAQSPGVAAQFDATPAAQAWLQSYIAAPPAQRRQMIDQVQGTPDAGPYTALFGPLASICGDY